MTVEIDLYSLLKFIGGMLAAIAFIFLIYRAYKGIATFFKSREYDLDKSGIKKRWQEIEAMLDRHGEMNYKLAVMEGDIMLDDILKKMGYHGETLGERLNSLTIATLPNIERIKEAHQTRNNIIHDPDYRLSLDETRKVLDVFEQAFRDLEVF